PLLGSDGRRDLHGVELRLPSGARAERVRAPGDDRRPRHPREGRQELPPAAEQGQRLPHRPLDAEVGTQLQRRRRHRHAGRVAAGEHGTDPGPHQGEPGVHRQRHHHGAPSLDEGSEGARRERHASARTRSGAAARALRRGGAAAHDPVQGRRRRGAEGEGRRRANVGMSNVLAAVRVAPSTTEIREYPMPDVPEDAALLKVEVGGICGTDVKLYKTPPTKAPVIMGHENIGYIAKAGREFTRRKGFKEGDLVFVEHYVMCGKCEWCTIGQYRHCENTDWRNNPEAIRYGYTSAERAPHLWGGFAQYMYLPWNAVVHHVPKGVTPELAGLVTPMANGVEWSLFDGGVGYDSTVLIQGPGQQGLSQTVVCKQAGASLIIVTGTSKDKA